MREHSNSRESLPRRLRLEATSRQLTQGTELVVETLRVMRENYQKYTTTDIPPDFDRYVF